MTNSSEKAGLDNAIRADFVRHGQTEYTGKPGDLTELGVEEIEQRAKEIAGGIDKDRECVVLWISPTERTRATASIITNVLEKSGISIVKESEIATLRDTDKSETTMLKDAARVRPGLPESEIKSWIELLGPAKKDETPEEVSTRFGAVVEHMSRAAARVKPLNGKQIHFILVSHGSHPIIEVLKTAGVLNKDFIPGSRAEMTIHKDSDTIDVSFGGWSGTILFNRDKRQIKPLPSESESMDTKKILDAINTTLLAKGYGPVSHRFKSLNAKGKILNERFVVEERPSPNGERVVVKTCELASESSTNSLKRESSNLKSLGLEVDRRLRGKRMEVGGLDFTIDVQRKVDEFEDGGFHYLVSKLCEDDKDLEASLTSAQRFTLILNVIINLQTLIPEGLENKKSYFLEEIPQRALRKALLPPEIVESIKQISLPLSTEEDVFPYVIVHSDIHGGNLALNKRGDLIEVDIMDTEGAHRGSKFEDFARIYFYARITKIVIATGGHTNLLNDFWLTDLVGREDEIMREALKTHEDKTTAEVLFRVWVINTTLEKVIYNSEFDREPYLSIVRAGKDLILENIRWFKERDRILTLNS